jgi:hypothetical protein
LGTGLIGAVVYVIEGVRGFRTASKEREPRRDQG